MIAIHEPPIEPASLARVDPRVLEAPRIHVRAIEVGGPEATTLLAPTGPAEAIARELAKTLPEERRALHRLLGLPDGGPLEIRVGYGREEFRALQPSRSMAPGWAAGVAYPGLGLIVLDAQAAGRSGDARGVLRHELAHIALARVLDTRIPHWFTEGFAMLYADEWTLSRSTVLARAAAARVLISLEDLDRGWPSSPSEVDLAYAQSASIVTYLASRDDGAPFHRMVAAMSEGMRFEDAIVAGYGQPLIVHELAWKDSLQTRFGWLPLFFDHQLMWGWAALLLVIGAWRIRRRSKRRLAQMEDGPDLEPVPDLEDEELVRAALEAADFERGPRGELH